MTRLLFAVRVSLVFALLFVLATLPPLICGVPLLIMGAVAVAAAYNAVPLPLGIVLVVLGLFVLRGSFTAIRIAWFRSVTFRRMRSWLVNQADQVYYDPSAGAWAYRSYDCGGVQRFPSKYEATAFATLWASRRRAAAKRPLPLDDPRPRAPRHAKIDADQRRDQG